MTDSYPVDYSALSGANFQRAVGTDPKKWAIAFAQTHLRNTMTRFTDDDLAQWFADAIEAGREEGRKQERKITGSFW